jgi:hypothetical protein
MSGIDFDQLEMLGVDAALNRCHALAGRIESALAKSVPLRDTAALGEVHAALNQAAGLLDLVTRNGPTAPPSPESSVPNALGRYPADAAGGRPESGSMER